MGQIGVDTVVQEGNKKKVIQYNKNGEFINEYDSITAASNATGIPLFNISKCCNECSKTSGGFIWEFKDKSRIRKKNLRKSYMSSKCHNCENDFL